MHRGSSDGSTAGVVVAFSFFFTCACECTHIEHPLDNIDYHSLTLASNRPLCQTQSFLKTRSLLQLLHQADSILFLNFLLLASFSRSALLWRNADDGGGMVMITRVVNVLYLVASLGLPSGMPAYSLYANIKHSSLSCTLYNRLWQWMGIYGNAFEVSFFTSRRVSESRAVMAK